MVKATVERYVSVNAGEELGAVFGASGPVDADGGAHRQDRRRNQRRSDDHHFEI